MKITMLSELGVFADGKPVGTPAEFLAKHPEEAGAFAAVFKEFVVAQHSGENETLLRRAIAAEGKLAALKATLDPTPLAGYFLVVELPSAIESADHFGLRGVARGGAWSGDLLRSLGENSYGLVKAAGLTVPVGEKISSLSELTRENLFADISRAMNRENVGQTPAGERAGTGSAKS